MWTNKSKTRSTCFQNRKIENTSCRSRANGIRPLASQHMYVDNRKLTALKLPDTTISQTMVYMVRLLRASRALKQSN